MADNYLENHYEEYLKKKAVWEKSRKHAILSKTRVNKENDNKE